MVYNYQAGVIMPFAKKFYKQLLVLFTALFLFSIAAMTLTARAASTVWDQGFETDTAGWDDSSSGWYGTATQVASGTDGITSSDGANHAIFEGDADSAPFSRFDGYRSAWPGTWTANVDVYLDTEWNAGTGFDYSVASSRQDGTHLRDFIFHVTKDTSTGHLIVADSNNTNFAPREDLETLNHYEVTTSGWYTLQHVFHDNGSGVLAVDLNLINDAGTTVFTETRSDATDLIDSVVGGNRYSWFTFINVDGGIAVDNHQLILNADTTAPDAPVAIGATSPVVSCGGTTDVFNVTLGWTIPDDDVGVIGYDYNVLTPNGTNWTTTVGSNSYSGAFNDGEGAYLYRVRAFDAAGNYSEWSNTCAVSYDNPATDETLSSKEECKDSGWMVSDAPKFRNQGDCVSYFASPTQHEYNPDRAKSGNKNRH